jgi:5-methylcytosine-specific restriction protein A
MKLRTLQSRIATIPLSQVQQGSVRRTTAEIRVRGRALQVRNLRVACRDSFTCQICHRVTDRGEGEVDHRIPLALGGGDELSNLQWLCIECHRAKTERENSHRLEP